MSSASTVTYTSVYTDSEPGRVFWGADEELSDGGSPRVIVYGYDGLPMQPVAPPSPDYVPGPEHPPSPDYVPGPKHPPSPVEVPYVPEPEYPEYLVPSDAEAPLEDQPLPADASPTALSPGYVADSDPDEDPEEDPEEDHDEEPFEDEDNDEEEEEHLALVDSSVLPVVDPVPSAGDTETRLRRAWKTVKLEPPMSPSIEAHIVVYAAAPTPPSPPPSPLSPWSSPLPKIPSPPLHVSSPPLPLPPPTVDSPTYAEAPLGYRAVGIRLRASSPSTYHPLHPSSPHLPPPVPTSLPLPSSPLPPLPASLFIPPPVDHREDILGAEPTGGHKVDYRFIGTMDAEIRCQRDEEVSYGIRDVWVDLAKAVEEEALASREAWAHSMGLSSAGKLSAALGQIQALQARDQTHADDPEGTASMAYNMPSRRTSTATARAAAAAARAAIALITADAVEQLIEARVSVALANHETL
ncbi:hypothetical protein Tco_0281855 [Tanacetum coccineum]